MREIMAGVLPPTEAEYGKESEAKQVNALWGICERMLKDIPEDQKWWFMYDDLELSVDRYSDDPDFCAYVIRYSYQEDDFGYVTTTCLLQNNEGKRSLEKIVFREDPELEKLMVMLKDMYDGEERERVDAQLEVLILKQTNEFLGAPDVHKHTASYLDAMQLTELLLAAA